ncbi:MAG: HD domain-containing protein [Clostridia bacterium]|nr:HD domain-containing protein [Clostridia bacterium]
MKYDINEFNELINDVINTDEFKTMKKYRHHVKSNLYDHSIKVAYLCFKHHKRFKSKFELRYFVRGALLHDFYLYDWHDKLPENRLHGFRHSKKALKNARERFLDLTPMEEDMIKNHMFPLTPVPPKTRAGWLVCFYDKVVAIKEYFSRKKRHWH